VEVEEPLLILLSFERAFQEQRVAVEGHWAF
jgi:hypothetical protein